MSHKHYEIQGSISDFPAGAVTGDIGHAYFLHFISLTFYTDDTFSTPVNPSAGTATILAAEDNFNFAEVQNGEVDVTNSNYARPYIQGYVSNVKVEFSGITGATHFKLRVASTSGV